jgi:hypothetical protein
MNNIVSVRIERTNNKLGETIYSLSIEHLGENYLPITTKLDFDDVYKAFQYLNTLENNQ